MITSYLKALYWKTNSLPLLGFPAGALVCVDHKPGGGFAGAPQKLTMAKYSSIPVTQPYPEPGDFPEPSRSVEYTIGGWLFEGYNYKKD